MPHHAEIDRVLLALARRQHGAIGRHQAEAAGATPAVIANRLLRGVWHQHAVDVFVVAGHPHDWKQRLMVATLCTRGAVVSGRAAAALHGFEGFPRGRPVITVPVGSNHRCRVATVRQSNLIDRVFVDRIPVNSATLTLFEIAGSVSFDEVESVLEAGLRTTLFDLAHLRRHYLRVAGSRRPGLRVMRALLDARDDAYLPPASELEQLLYDTFEDAGFGPLERQPHLPWRPDAPQRLDGLLTRPRIILEADGRSWHGQLRDMENDRRRDRDALAHGYVPLRWTYHDLKHDRRGSRATVAEVSRRLLTGGFAVTAGGLLLPGTTSTRAS